MNSSGDVVPSQEHGDTLEKIAKGIVSRGMEVPAVLFLEMNKPLSGITAQGLLISSPLIAPFVGFDKVTLASELLQDRANIEKLICRIEELSEEQRLSRAAARKPEGGRP